jgi:hypothetical protein
VQNITDVPNQASELMTTFTEIAKLDPQNFQISCEEFLEIRDTVYSVHNQSEVELALRGLLMEKAWGWAVKFVPAVGYCARIWKPDAGPFVTGYECTDHSPAMALLRAYCVAMQDQGVGEERRSAA